MLVLCLAPVFIKEDEKSSFFLSLVFVKGTDMRVFRNKKTSEVYRLNESEDDNTIKAMEYNDAYQELYELK